jgi:hypothetical protein
MIRPLALTELIEWVIEQGAALVGLYGLEAGALAILLIVLWHARGGMTAAQKGLRGLQLAIYGAGLVAAIVALLAGLGVVEVDGGLAGIVQSIAEVIP